VVVPGEAGAGAGLLESAVVVALAGKMVAKMMIVMMMVMMMIMLVALQPTQKT